MINSVRQTCLSIVNKENQGFITPVVFNQFAHQAQIMVFQDYFEQYRKSVYFQNARTTGVREIADRKKQVSEKITPFIKDEVLTFFSDAYLKPDDCHFIIDIYNQYGTIDKMEYGKFKKLIASNYTAPTKETAIYCEVTGSIQVAPILQTDVSATYIRTPKKPFWAYQDVMGSIAYDPQASVDFEVHPEDEPRLIMHICKLAGINIREYEITQLMDNTLETEEPTSNVEHKRQQRIRY